MKTTSLPPCVCPQDVLCGWCAIPNCKCERHVRNRTPPELDKIVDAVLAYRPKPKTKAAKRRKRRAQNAKRKNR